jgi:P pilus assembly chaperone PapD
VYPAQMILMPGDEASVQVRWIGAAESNVERAFSLTTREVPIPQPELEQEQSETAGEGVRINLNVLMNYDVRVYVTPRGAKPKVTVETVAVRSQSEAAPAQLEVTLANHGTAHHSLRELSLVLMPLDANGVPLRQPPVTLAARDVPGMSAALLAGGRRRLLIPWPAELPAGPVRAVLSE